MQVIHVTVLEPDAPATSARRFVFENEDEAWSSYVRAIQAGFSATAERVERTRELASVAVAPRNTHGEHAVTLFKAKP